MVQEFAYKQIECENNKRLVQCIDRSTIEKIHEITEISKDVNLVLTFSL